MKSCKYYFAKFTLLILPLLPLRLHADVNMAFNFYPWLDDVNNDSDLTITTFITFPARLSYFSFINFGGLMHTGPSRFIITEQNLIWNVSANYPIDIVAQDTIRSGHDNDTVHAGLRWRTNSTEGIKDFFNAIHLNYSFQIFPVRFDQRDLGGWQLSHVYQMTFPYISERLYFSGFFDHNISERSIIGGRRDNIVTENQFGIRLYKRLHAVFEYRFNEYRRSNKNNLGAGIEIKTTW